MTMPYDNVPSPYHIDKPALDESRVYQSIDTSRPGVASQKSNHYSDPLIWTPSPHTTCCPNPTDAPSPIDHETVSSWCGGPKITGSMAKVCSRQHLIHEEQTTCYEHGCDGRKFSSKSNLTRHQRERAGRTPLSSCCWCGATFYRRWTRNHHVLRMSCLRVSRSRDLVITSGLLGQQSI